MKLSDLTTLGALGVAAGALSGRRGAVPARPRAGLLARLYREINDDRLLSVAAGVAFYSLLALVPSLAAAVSLFGLIADPVQLAKLPDVLTTLLPYEAVTLVQDQARRLAAQGASTLSLKLVFALALSLWSASSALRAMFDALNVIGEQPETRSLVRLYLTALAATLAGVVVFALAVVLIGASPAFLKGLPPEILTLYAWLRWPMFFCVAVISITTLYWIGPSRPPNRFGKLARGAAVAAALWAAGSSLFGWYVAKLGNYTATYGSLATVVVMMTWLWVSTAVILLGAQLNCELDRE